MITEFRSKLAETHSIASFKRGTTGVRTSATGADDVETTAVTAANSVDDLRNNDEKAEKALATPKRWRIHYQDGSQVCRTGMSTPLRARSAVRRYPVVEWRQRTEVFHSRSITASRSISWAKAWRRSDGESGPLRPIDDHDDRNPVHQADHSQPDWYQQSHFNSPRTGLVLAVVASLTLQL